MINFNLFVLPFFFGLLYMLLAIGKSWYRWISALPAIDKVKVTSGIRHPGQVISALKEVFLEAFIHRRMWKLNPLLGYLHMSFALGWLLLIVLGNMESRFYSGTHLNAPYYPIFLKFFIHDKLVLFFEVYSVPGVFRFIMDFVLLFVLSGLVLAFIKRKHSKWFGMKQTTTHQLTDRVALTCLWLIFPMRLLAESYTAGYYGNGGGFMTQPLGNALVYITPLPSEFIAYTMWWGYSLVLGIFFVTLPYSRYMHIPTEVLLIFFRHFGIQPKKWYSSFTETEVHACSRCGVCIDVCPLRAAEVIDSQAVYFIRGVRDNYVPEEITQKCLICGRCQEVCPVGIKTDALRLIKRRELNSGQATEFRYLSNGHAKPADVIYFSGCMTHLTPTIIRATKGIMTKAGVNYIHLDENQTICCGRPLMIAGKDRQASELIEFNKLLIKQTQAKLLVTSCPICYRVFREEYNIPIRIQHHSQYILDLVKTGKIPLQGNFRRVAYHDPCELGRGTKTFEAPRELLGKVADLVPVRDQTNNAHCCGGSLGIFEISSHQRDTMTKQALEILLEHEPETLATACPLCKKTFSPHSPVKVMDIAELVYQAIPEKELPTISQLPHLSSCFVSAQSRPE
ncbi:MAG: (Fe-S)-binding protein [Bacteroidales bacterium]|jgi:Fe-S oxidoreductase|nr:(Fe-S)-binding protein [Bacteroidales bacterium]